MKYRVKTPDGRMQGGAMYALERGLNMRWLGLIFAFFAAFASFGIGCIMLALHYGVATGLFSNESGMGSAPIAAAAAQTRNPVRQALVFGIILFAYSTVLGWAYYGERCVEYCFGKNALIPYRILYVLVAAIAPVVALDLVWTIADI